MDVRRVEAKNTMIGKFADLFLATANLKKK